MAFNSQSPALHRGTIRENIVLNSPFDVNRYNAVVKGCCLEDDFAGEVLRVTGGDSTLLAFGSKNLSGGQKLR